MMADQGKSYKALLDLYDEMFFQKSFTHLLKSSNSSVSFKSSSSPRITKLDSLYTLYVPKCDHASFQVWFEFIILKLLVILNDAKDRYEVEEIAVKLLAKMFESKPPIPIPPLTYQNWSESCYIDTVLVTLFFSGRWFQMIESSDVSKIHIHNILKNILIDDYNKINGKDRDSHHKCVEIRTIIRKLIPHPLSSFNVSETFGAFCDVFPVLKTHKIPYVNLKRKLIDACPRKWSTIDAPITPAWEFMDGDTIESRTGRIILWEEFNGNRITFQNTLAPYIKQFASMDSEAIEYQGNILIHKKVRCFGEYILGGKYRLVSVIVHKSSKNSLNSGHYICYIRPKFDSANWFEYDDLAPKWAKLSELPKDVFLDDGYSRPELYFYEKVRDDIRKIQAPKGYNMDVFDGSKLRLAVKYGDTSVITANVATKVLISSLPKHVSITRDERGIFYYKYSLQEPELVKLLEVVKKYDSSP